MSQSPSPQQQQQAVTASSVNTSNIPIRIVEDETSRTKHQQTQKVVATSSSTKTTTQFKTDCKDEHTASIQCSIDNYDKKDIMCASFYEAYKECRKRERYEANLKLEKENNDSSNNIISSFFNKLFGSSSGKE